MRPAAIAPAGGVAPNPLGTLGAVELHLATGGASDAASVASNPTVHTLASAATGGKGAASIQSLWGMITDPGGFVRLLQVFGGMGLIVLGVVVLDKDVISAAGTAAGKTVAAGKAASALAIGG